MRAARRSERDFMLNSRVINTHLPRTPQLEPSISLKRAPSASAKAFFLVSHAPSNIQ